MVRTIIGNPASAVKSQSLAAAQMAPSRRQFLAVAGITRTQPLSTLARENDVSRKFLYAQVEKAVKALDAAFSPTGEQLGGDTPLFYLPVTKDWIRGFVVSLALSCHAPYRGILDVLQDHLNSHLSIGTVHNILHEAVSAAREVNAREDLSAVRVGAHDEIFQCSKPVLTGVDVRSLYCYLLSLEDHRDADTWGVRLLELEEKGLHPERTIADFAGGLRAGQADVWPDVPCDGDTFHALLDVGRLATYLENRAVGVMTARDKLERRMEISKKRGRGNKLSKKLGNARMAEDKALCLADDVALLAKWLHEDILSLVGPDLQTRRELLDFIIEELKQRENLAPHRIGPVLRLLENQREGLLAFVSRIDERLGELAQSFHVDPGAARSLYELEGLSLEDPERYRREVVLRQNLRHTFYPLQQQIKELLAQTVRASSAVENLNSRLREYFHLRRHLGPDYLELLRFYLNHHRFPRSERPERAGKSPAEILAGRTLPHWLEQLGLTLYRNTEGQRAAA